MQDSDQQTSNNQQNPTVPMGSPGPIGAPQPSPAPANIMSENSAPATIESAPVYSAPVPDPNQIPGQQYTTPHPPVNAGQIVLQWLTYAFWGWTVLATSVLVATILAYYITGTKTGEFTPYGIAAVLVLLPISIVCDFFYNKYEPQKKTGASSVVMIIHAVIFAILGIGSLILVVFSIVSKFTSSATSNDLNVSLYSGMIITVLYAAVFLRTLRPSVLPWVRGVFIVFMIVVVGTLCILGVTGPMSYARVTRNDTLIASNLSAIQTAITNYATTNKQLPGSLSDVTLSGDAKKLVTENLVQYQQDKRPVSYDSYNSTGTSASTFSYSETKKYYFQLCVTYTKASDTRSDAYVSPISSTGDDGYDTYISAYTHPAGKVCYKIKTN